MLLNLAFFTIGSVLMLFVYAKVLRLVRGIRRTVGLAERGFCGNIAQRRMRTIKKHAWFTCFVIVAFDVYCVTYAGISVALNEILEECAKQTRERYSQILAWSWVYFFLDSALTPVVIWISSSEVRVSVARLLLNLWMSLWDISTIEPKTSKMMTPAVIS